MAVDGKEGHDSTLSDLHGTVLFDMNLPSPDGWTVASMLRVDAWTASVPLLALTAPAMSGGREKATMARMQRRPFQANRLVQTVEQITTLAGRWEG